MTGSSSSSASSSGRFWRSRTSMVGKYLARRLVEHVRPLSSQWPVVRAIPNAPSDDPFYLFESSTEFSRQKDARLHALYRDHVAQCSAAVTAGSPLLAWCFCCVAERRFRFDESASPIWRESLICEGCGLNARQRAAAQALIALQGCQRRDVILMTEVGLPLSSWMARRMPRLVCSGFSHEKLSSGKYFWRQNRRVRHEDLTALSFPTSSLRHIVTLDVLEHVADYRRAVAEMARVLTPGGGAIVGIPFVLNSETTLIRASHHKDGSIIHHEAPEYHDDVGTGDVLCYQNFGWDLLEVFRVAGFRRVRLGMAYDPASAHLDWGNVYIVADR